MKVNNNRILTFSEFDKAYGSNGIKTTEADINDEYAVNKIKNAPSNFESPSLENGNDIDGVNSGNATRTIRSDYEAFPGEPETISKDRIKKLRDKLKRDVKKESDGLEEVEETGNVEKENTSRVTNDNLTDEEKAEMEREEQGNY